MGLSSCGEEAPPMKETVQALLETLVSPLLSRRASYLTPPSVSQEEAVGKQMHAAVLLYNYFHRKQFLNVQFLDFKTFCEAAVVARPNLLACTGYKNKGEETTITEKIVREAFDICDGLSSLTNHPHKEGWPVSKVAVFLVDSMRKNCLLVSDSVTKGVWSLIEKEVSSPARRELVLDDIEKQKTAAKKYFRSTTYSRHASCLATADEAVLLHIAYSAVKEKTGLDSASLVHHESHYVYSLTQARSTARFYLMQCLKEIDGQVGQVPISDVINSLQELIVTKVSDSYETTQAVAFFHLLPYEGIISDWLSRQNLLLNRSENSDFKVQNYSGAHKSDSHPLKYRTQDKIIPSGEISESLKANSDPATTENDYRKVHKSQGSEFLLGVPDEPLLIGSEEVLIKDMFVTTDDEGHAQLCCKQKQIHDQDICHPSESGMKDKFGATTLEAKPQENGDFDGKFLKEVRIDGTALCSKGNVMRNELSVVEYGADTNEVDSFVAVLSSKRGALLQAAMRVLDKRRDDLLRLRQLLLIRQTQLEDAIAICEKKIDTVRAGGDDASAVMIETVIEACDVASSKGEGVVFYEAYAGSEDKFTVCGTKRRRLSQAILSLHNPCEELDEICGQNNWVLPTYTVSPSKGGFVASVTVHGLDFNCSAGGDAQTKPLEARESAATCMLNKLRRMVNRV